MRLGYFTMPLHPFERDTTETLHEDRQTIILADKLGFYDAFVGEHLTDKAENVTNSLLFFGHLDPGNQDHQTGQRHLQLVALAPHTAGLASGHV